ncbi:MAG TPA: amino acid adenylation domain-containing protein, partial [Pyrinomonadaceae bacterium]|nr:amino acid adenylation domain-containing protein [Pyrinomonadaceae bacterium]
MSEEIIEGFRLSPAQQRLWQQMNRYGASAFRSAVRISVRGPLDRGVLRRAWLQLATRHEVLRTTFSSTPGLDLPVQVIGDADEPASDHAMVCGGARDGWQVRVQERGDLESEVEVVTSAMLADARTMQNLVAELARCYEAALANRELENQLPADVVQYADVSEWQHEMLESEEAERARQLGAGNSEVLRLPHERDRVDSTGYAPQSVTVEVSREAAEKLKEIGVELDASIEEVLEAGWRVLLWRLSGEADVTVARLFDGRRVKHLKSAFGLFAKYLTVPCRLAATYRFSKVVRQLKDSVRTISAQQDYLTFEDTPDNSLIGFDLELLQDTSEGGGVSFSISELYSCVERFKLRLSVQEANGRLRFALHYDPAVYAAETVERWAASLATLLENAARQPHALIRDLEIIGEREHRQLLVEWNDTAVDYQNELCIHQLFEAQVVRTPDVPAVVFNDSRLSYRELNDRANQVARYLRRHGVGAEVLVGVCLERSVDLVVAVLGVLKAGGAYVPLDPEQPPSRLSRMIADAGTAVLLTKHSVAARFSNAVPSQVVCIDTESETIARESKETLDANTGADNLAYVIYTSGSTGTPKGVMVQHRSVLNLLTALQRAIYVNVPAPAHVTLNAPFSFDASVKQLIQLLAGHTLYLVPEEVRRDGEQLLRWLGEQRVTVFDCTPAQLQLLFDAGPGGATTADETLRAVLVGGEAINDDLWTRLGSSSLTRYYNVYGPTECTVDALVCEIKSGEPPNIGTPVTNTQAFVLSEAQQLLATGVTGELHLGGAGLARGYLNRPELTAEKFVPDAYSGKAGARLYRTGDLVRYSPNGEIEFKGRTDHQVKVRGYRVELGEIEAVLRGHQAVRECVVTTHEDESRTNRLVAYVVEAAGNHAGNNGDANGRYSLPNGMTVAHENKNETDYLYDEIFQKQTYFRHGIGLREGACVFDVGANIGLFTLFITQHWKDLTVYAFEPIPHIYANLQHNASFTGGSVKTLPVGLSNEEKIETFAFYPRYTMMSGINAYADAAQEVEVIKQFLRNEEQSGVAGASELLTHSDDLLAGRFESKLEQCRLRVLSDIIREEKVDRIDLLKVDVQRAELDVLQGISDEDWQRIEQVVMEVHDVEGGATAGRIDEITALLRKHSFSVVVEQEDLLQGTDRYNLYAVKQRTNGHHSNGASFTPPSAAAVVATNGENSKVLSDELRRYLREQLPEYMMPSTVVMLDKLPLTPHGKVDRKALPAPESTSGTSSEQSDVLPRTPHEELVANVWESVLKVKAIGRDDNFFELGGHSLLATQVMSRMREVFQIDLPLRTLFEEPTVAAFAAGVGEALKLKSQPTPTPPIRPVSRSGELPLSFAQQRLWFLDQWEPSSPFYNSPSALRLSGQVDLAVLQRTLFEVVRRHEVLRTAFPTVDGQPRQRIVEGWQPALPLIDLSSLDQAMAREAVKRLVQREALQPFELATGPLLRATLLRLGAEEHVLLFTMHHIVSDGWSMGLLVREVAALYKAYQGGEESPLEELAVQYADYAVWQREWLAGEVLEGQLEYWRRQLAGAPAVLELPTDRPRPRVQSYRGATSEFRLNTELTAGLKELSRRSGVTLFMTLLAGFEVLLWRLSGQEDICVGTAIANRTRRETEGVIGFFVNTLVLRVEMSGELSFRELLGRVREVCLGAYGHQEVPFERLVEELRPERSLSHSPLFQIAFGLDNAPREELELPGLKLSGMELEDEVVRFDLTLWMNEEAGELSGRWTYRTELFDAQRVEQMTRQWERLLQSIVANPEAAVETLEMFTEAEKEQREIEATVREDL